MMDGERILSPTAMSTRSERTTSTSDCREPGHAAPNSFLGSRTERKSGDRVRAWDPNRLQPQGAGFYLVQRGPWRESIDTRISLTALSPHDPGQDPGAGFSAFEGMPLGVG